MDSVQVVALLRARVFSLTAQDLLLDVATCPDLWGLIMEIGFVDDVVTLVVLDDGSVSIYLRSGKGRIGCGLHSGVRATAAQALQQARTVTLTEAANAAFPMPVDDEVHFYFHTSTGLRACAVSRTQLEKGNQALSELYCAARAVIDRVELTGAGHPIADAIEDAAESVNSQPESTLSAMSRGKPCRILPSVGSAARRSRR